MKRRVVSIITALALCLSLCPVRALADTTMTMAGDRAVEFVVDGTWTLDVNGYNLTASGTSVIIVQKTGKAKITGSGTITSQKGAGVQVEAGGYLNVAAPGLVISGSTCGLDVASGATVRLSGGTFTGKTAAIQVANGTLADLLDTGYAYFDANGNPISAADAAAAKTLVVKACTDHPNKVYTQNTGTPTHSWTCSVCGTSAAAEPCVFTFDENGLGTCSLCNRQIRITVDEDSLPDLVYDGTLKPGDIDLTVTLNDGTTLTKGTDYVTAYEPRDNVGEIIVTVTGVTYDGTFTKTYQVTQDQPTLQWDTTTTPGSVTVTYDGSPVKKTDLPNVIITVESNEDLSQDLEYYYKKQSEADTAYVKGLPTNAGTYDIMVRLPELPNYKAASSDPITLIINKISALKSAPTAATLVYNGSAQALVNAGVVENGAVMEYATEENGLYSTDIPTGINAGDYTVWYRVANTENYDGVPATKVDNVLIKRKSIVPVVELSKDSYVYDGGYQRPKVTVRDGYDGPALPQSEYTVEYDNNQNVSTENNPAKVIVTDKEPGNYAIQGPVEVTFQITHQPQAALQITGMPQGTITYGSSFTLGTSGGSGNGLVTWEIMDGGANVATVDPDSGTVTIKGVGTATVQATKSGTDPVTNVTNYGDAIARWKITTSPKPVVATVTAEDKTYDGKTDAKVHAEVKDGVLSGDEIKIENLSGAFSDADAGQNKTVTVNANGATITGKNSGLYTVTYSSSSAPVTANITKAVVSVTTEPAAQNPTYSGSPQALVSPAAVNASGVTVEYALSKDGPYSAEVPKGINAGDYEVWYRVPETNNYTGIPASKVEASIDKKTVTPVVTLDSDSFPYSGQAIEPRVTVTENGKTIPTPEYTVAYSDNIDVTNDAKATVTARADGNYTFSVSKTFAITAAGAEWISEPQRYDSLTYNGKAQNLVSAGKADGGTAVYSLSADGPYTSTIPQGTDAQTYSVYYKIQSDGNHTDTAASVQYVTIKPKEITPGITLEYNTTTYNGSEKKPAVTVTDGTTSIDESEFTLFYSDNTDAGKASVTVSDANGGNYRILSKTVRFTIQKAAPTVNAPTGQTGLKYHGGAQELIARGSSSHGRMVYSLDGANYSDTVPTGTAVGSYTVHYKVLGDSNHTDSTGTVNASIVQNTVNSPKIILFPDTFPYNGSQQKPDIKVYDDDGRLIPENEYTATIAGEKGNDMVNVDTYTVTITATANGNYDIQGDNTKDFQIVPADQEVLTIEGIPDRVYYGNVISLTTTGGTGSGTVTWSVSDGANSTITENGVLTVKDVGTITITAVRSSASGNYDEISTTRDLVAAPKPVTAVLTVQDKIYDNSKSATVEAKVNSGDLVESDSITIRNVTGTFEDADAGSGKRVIIDASKAQANGTNSEKYAITYPDTATASIQKAAAAVSPTPKAVENLTYDAGQAHVLVNASGVTETGGNLVYSLDGVNYSMNLPTAQNADTYKVYYKVLGDRNHTDSGIDIIDVTIAQQAVTTPQIDLRPSTAPYDGSEKRPEKITVRDQANYEIPESEYRVEYDSNTNWIDAGSYTVKIVDRSGGNYSINDATAKFQITASDQTPLTIVNQTNAAPCYGDSFRLYTTGGSGSGAVTWVSDNTSVASVDSNGLVTITGVGEANITATKAATGNYNSAAATYRITAVRATPAIVTPPAASTITSGEALKESTLTGGKASVDGSFAWADGDDTPDVGTSEHQVTFTPDNETNYNTVTLMVSVTVAEPDAGGGDGDESTDPENPGTTTPETPDNPDTPDTTDPDPDEAGGDTNGGTGTGTGGGTGTGTGGGTGTGTGSGTSGSTGGGTSGNTGGGTAASSALMQTSVRDGAAVAVLNAAGGSELVREAVANQSKNVVIKPEITGNVTKTEVSIPASTVSQLSSQTDAAITVSTPIADVTIPNGALDTLSGAGGAVKVTTEQTGNAVALTLSADGRSVESVPGGLTLALPVEDAGPGTVAVLVRDDGTRETIRKSVAEDGVISVPLDGSATVEIVDNSKQFADVPAESWSADAVAFASAHELFNGTSETTFSPNQPMSRAMLATVLYNLEGRPDQALAEEFSDVSDDAWYAAGVSWAAANGITNGYSDGQFGPNDSVTREQLAVMLWRYAGSPAADGGALDFTDADEASDYALEALRWAAANGILNGYGDGRLDPGGQATRAQAAQMLKNFMENT